MSYLKLLRQSKARRKEFNSDDEAKRDLVESQWEQPGASAVFPVSSADHRRLKEAGFKPKVSFRKRMIWERPDTGFYYSEEIASHHLDTKNIRNNSGANTRR